MSNDPRDDPLLEAALTITDAGTVDWERLQRALPEETAALAGLEALAGIEAAHAGDDPAAPAPDGEPAGGEPRAEIRFRWGALEARHRLGEGSFGEVWAAWDPGLRREVALKLWRGGSGDVRLWLQEARRLARVRHANVVTVHGADVHDGRAGLWMDRIHGRTLDELLATVGPFAAREAIGIGVELCGALAAVHGAGMVHGDLKTRNVMREGGPEHVTGAGRIVLMDFGSAREHRGESGSAGSRGTPLFAAPEVLRGEPVTPAADFYALGVVLFRLVTGRYPVEAPSLAELQDRLERGALTPLRSLRPDLPAAFIAAVERALSREPARRFPDAAAFERALLAGIGSDHGAADELRRAGGRRRLAVAARVGAGALVLAGLWFGRPHLERAWANVQMQPTWVSRGTLLDLQGTVTNGEFGHRIANVGDVDGDGADDLLIGAPGEGPGGRAYLRFLGSSPRRKDLVLEGEAAGDRFGHCVSRAGDLNGDGHRDFAVTANSSDAGARDAGRVYVYFGGPGLDERPDLVLTGSHPAQNLGFAVAAGDVNGDGIDDLLVGAPLDSQSGFTTGRAFGWFGGPKMDGRLDLELLAPSPEGQFGIAVEAIGDFNADGHGDFAVGANWDHSDGRFAGRVYVYFGGPRVDGRPDLILHGHRRGEQLGMIGRAGDVNGDGHPDLVVGAERGDGLEPQSGAVYVYFGGPAADNVADARLRGDRRGDGFGFLPDASTDFDRDGTADVVIAARFHDTQHEGAGRVYLYRGGRRVRDLPAMVLDGPMPMALFGMHAAALGDLSGDGFPDLAVGALMDGRGIRTAGSVQVFDLAPWHIATPRPGDAWPRGGRATLAWTGAGRAEVSLSLDQGRTWSVLTRRAGGRAGNTLTVNVPPDAGTTVRVRLAAPGSIGQPGHRSVEQDVPIR